MIRRSLVSGIVAGLLLALLLGCNEAPRSSVSGSDSNAAPAFDCSVCKGNEECAPNGCVLKGCAAMSGRICAPNEECFATLVESLESKECCLGECRADPCEGVVCQNTGLKCVEGQCVKKTCAERNGSVCGPGTKCSESTVSTSDTALCCLNRCMTYEE